MRSPYRAAALAILALPLLAAAAPEKQIVNDLRRDLSTNLRQQKSLLANERSILLTQLDTAIATARTTVQTPVECLGGAGPIAEFQRAVQERIEAHLSFASNAGQSALNDFLLLVPGATAPPVGLTYGDG